MLEGTKVNFFNGTSIREYKACLIPTKNLRFRIIGDKIEVKSGGWEGCSTFDPEYETDISVRYDKKDNSFDYNHEWWQSGDEDSWGSWRRNVCSLSVDQINKGVFYVEGQEDKTYYGHSFDVEIKPTSVKINNCCSGNWQIGDWYYYYIKLTTLVAEVSEQLKTYCQQVDRTDLQEEERLNNEFDSVKQQIETINYNEERDKHIKELDSAEFIGCYEKLTRWDTGYVEGQDTYRLKSLFKVLHRTPKKYIVEEYTRDYEGDHEIDVWTKRWYGGQEKIKKENIYSTYRYQTIYYPYNAVNRDEIEIRD